MKFLAGWIGGWMVIAIAIGAGSITYIELRGLPGVFYAAFCIAYTICVSGNALVDRCFWPRSLTREMALGKILLIHAGFLLGVAGIAGLVESLKPADVGWTLIPDGRINWYLVAAIAVPYLFALIEGSVLSAKPTKATETQQS
jgi:hypothetical protein